MIITITITITITIIAFSMRWARKNERGMGTGLK